MYLPPTAAIGALDTSGRVPVSTTNFALEGVKSLLSLVDGVYIDSGGYCLVGIASNTRGGAFQHLRSLTMGRVVDTMRSRRNKLAEDPEELTY
jgi:hypothetical protein